MQLYLIMIMAAALAFASGAAGLKAYAAESHTQGSASWRNDDGDNTADLYIRLIDPDGDMITASQVDIMLSAENQSSIEEATFEFDPQWNGLKLKSYNYDERTGKMTVIVATDGKSGIYSSTVHQDEVKAGTLKVNSHEPVRAVIVSSKAVSDGLLSEVVSIHGMEVSLAANLDPPDDTNANNAGNSTTDKQSHTGGHSGSSGTGLSALSSKERKNEYSTVINGIWTYDRLTDKWTLDNHRYKNQWVYVFNGYATPTQGQYDWFCFDNEGNMVTGWYTDSNGVTFYLNESTDGTRGAMKTGWVQIQGKWYYFNKISDGTKGRLLRSTTTPDGYKVDSDGVWVQ